METQATTGGKELILPTTTNMTIEQLRDITLVLGDNMEYMKTLPDGAFDLAIVDPPYGILSKAGSMLDKFGEMHKQWDKAIPTDEYFHELFRVSKNQIIWGGNYFPILWDKGCKGFIFWYKQQPLTGWADGELAWTSFNKPAACFNYRYYGAHGSDDHRFHPTQKPVDLYRWLLQNYAKPSLHFTRVTTKRTAARYKRGWSYTQLGKLPATQAGIRIKRWLGGFPICRCINISATNCPIYDQLKANNMKTYVITLSHSFLQGHPRAGEPTDFYGKFMRGVFDDPCCGIDPPKIHTIRGNYDLWAKRIEEVQQGKAELSIRQWTGKPYNSPQTPLATLTAADGVGVQKVEFSATLTTIDGVEKELDIDVMAYNDGLTPKDFCDWFKKYDLTKPMAIIHFTNFRY